LDLAEHLEIRFCSWIWCENVRHDKLQKSGKMGTLLQSKSNAFR